jgi:hypothetical protein
MTGAREGESSYHRIATSTLSNANKYHRSLKSSEDMMMLRTAEPLKNKSDLRAKGITFVAVQRWQ